LKICGLQKLTLLDYPGTVACTVFLGGCNFRCPWCHNYDLATNKVPEIMTIPNLLGFLQERKDKLEGVAITGGEPCLNTDLPDLLRQIKSIGYNVKLDTNGSQYDMLKTVIETGLVDYVAMDIKNSQIKYKPTTGAKYTVDLSSIESIRKSVNLLMLKGDVDYEFRTTVIDEFHELSDFEAIGIWIQGAKHYYLQPFVDRESVPYEGFHAPSQDKLRGCLEVVRKYVPQAEIRGI